MQLSGMEESQFQEIPQNFTPGRPKKSLPKKTVVLITVIVLIILAFLFVKISGTSTKQSTSTVSTTPSATPIESGPTETPASSSSETPTPTPTPSPTPKPSANPIDKATGLDRSKLSVTIQNGSGEAGVAGKASDYLKGLGYDVTSTGNADNYDYTNVTIQVKADKSDYLALLKKDLGFNYTVGNTSSDLSGTASAEAIVIIGK